MTERTHILPGAYKLMERNYAKALRAVTKAQAQADKIKAMLETVTPYTPDRKPHHFKRKGA